MGSLFTLSRALASRQLPGTSVTAQQELSDAKERSVYFDILGLGMVRALGLSWG